MGKNKDKKKGRKNDDDKLPYYIVLCEQFPLAINALIKRSLQGHVKYTDDDGNGPDKNWDNWEKVDKGYTRYSNALLRHLFKEGEDTSLEHDIAVLWNACARLELKLRKLKKKKKKKK